MDRNRIAKYVLIGSLVFVFGYFGIEKFINPELWVGWLPDSIDGFLGLSKYQWLNFFGVVEIASAIALLIPVRRLQQLATAGIILQLIGILTQTGWNEIAVRDIDILLGAVALLILL